MPTSTVPLLKVSNPTYINSSASISESIRRFNCLDQIYTPEEDLHHIRARVTFSLGTQPTTDHECRFWHARRMAFIQFSLNNTALSWYILLNDKSKQDWPSFVQALKKPLSSQKTLTMPKLRLLFRKDIETVCHFARKS